MRLYISSGRHLFTDVEGRVEEIEKALSDPDVVFFEQREIEDSWTTRAGAWLFAPHVFIGITVWIFIVRICSLFVSNDKAIADEICTRYSIPKLNVDKPLHRIIRNEWYSWAVANWGLTLLPAILLVSSNNPMVDYFAVSLLAITILCLMMAFMGGSNAERNWHMVTTIADAAEDPEIESACLITGGHHQAGLEEMLSRIDGIEQTRLG